MKSYMKKKTMMLKKFKIFEQINYGNDSDIKLVKIHQENYFDKTRLKILRKLRKLYPITVLYLLRDGEIYNNICFALFARLGGNDYIDGLKNMYVKYVKLDIHTTYKLKKISIIREHNIKKMKILTPERYIELATAMNFKLIKFREHIENCLHGDCYDI
jgi:hypothetical protein